MLGMESLKFMKREFTELIKNNLSKTRIMLLVVMTFATWSIWIQAGAINKDGLLYLKQAFFFSEGNTSEALHLFPSPFYSYLIGSIFKFTGASILWVAHGINLFLFGIATLFYLKTLRLINQSSSIIFYGGIALLSFIPIMDNYVGMLVRDHGMWAGCMAATYFFLKARETDKNQYYFLWNFSILFAVLFRPEALIYLVVMPCLEFYLLDKKSFKTLLSSFRFLLAIFFVSLIFIAYSIIVMEQNILLIVSKKILSITSFFDSPSIIATDDFWLSFLLNDYSKLVLLGGLTFVFIYKWLVGLGLIHLSIFLFGLKNNFCFITKYKSVIFTLAGTALLLVFLNLINVYVVTGRYFVMHWWWLLLIIAVCFQFIDESLNIKYIKLIRKILYVFMLVLILNTVIDSKKIDVERLAGDYLGSHYKSNVIKSIDADRVLFYAGFPLESIIYSSKINLNEADILVIKSNSDLDFSNFSDFQELEAFVEKNNHISIMRKKN
jgi:hypothetical protein